MELGIHVANPKVAEEAIAEGNNEKIQKAHTIIAMGPRRKNAPAETIENILQKKKTVSSYI